MSNKFRKSFTPVVAILGHMMNDLNIIQAKGINYSPKGFRSSAANLLARRYMRKK